MELKRSQHRPPNRPRNVPKSTPKRPKIDPKITQNRPQNEPKSTPKRPQNGVRSWRAIWGPFSASSGRLPGCPGEVPVASRRVPGGPWGVLGGSLGGPWGVPGRSWGVLGGPWGLLGRSLGRPGVVPGGLGDVLDTSWHVWGCLGAPGEPREAAGGRFGLHLGPPGGAKIKQKRRRVVQKSAFRGFRSDALSGAHLEPFRADLGGSWGLLGASWGPLGGLAGAS